MTPAELRLARRRLGLSYRELARLLGMGRHGARRVRRWERGEEDIRADVPLILERLRSGKRVQH